MKNISKLGEEKIDCQVLVRRKPKPLEPYHLNMLQTWQTPQFPARLHSSVSVVAFAMTTTKNSIKPNVATIVSD